MRRMIFTVLALGLLAGTASADHRWRGRDTSNHSGGTVVRDHRGGGRDYVRVDRSRDHYRRDWGDRDRYRHRVRVERRPVYVNNNRFVFHGGIVRSYNRPVIRHRYYDVRYRPSIIVEHYDPVPGYIWVAGSWNWNGFEWIWSSGYWAVDPNYQEYQDEYYDSYEYQQY